MADLLLGLATVNSGYEPVTRSHHYYYGVYAQDIWKLTSKLTVTYGLRYDLELGDIENENLLNYIDTTSTSPINGKVTALAGDPALPTLVGGVGIPGLNGTSRELQLPEKLHFSPRLGLAYQLNRKTIVHTGLGIFFHPAAAWQQFPNADGAIRSSTSIDAQSVSAYPLAGYNLASPFPSGLPTPYGNAAGLGIDLGQSIAGPGRHQNIADQINYSLDVQRLLPANFVVTAAYAGNEGEHLMQPLYMNQIPDADLAQGSALIANVNNPFAGVITDPTSTLSLATTTYEQLLRPFPQFNTVEVLNSGVGHSTYNAGQLTVEHRAKSGLSELFGYTFSKALDNVGEMTSVAGTYTGLPGLLLPALRQVPFRPGRDSQCALEHTLRIALRLPEAVSQSRHRRNGCGRLGGQRNLLLRFRPAVNGERHQQLPFFQRRRLPSQRSSRNLSLGAGRIANQTRRRILQPSRLCAAGQLHLRQREPPSGEHQ